LTLYTFDQGWTAAVDAIGPHDVTDLAISPDGHVYVLTRYPSAVHVFSLTGDTVGSWESPELTAKPHGITVGDDGSLFVVLQDDCTVKRFSMTGALLGVIGESGHAADSGMDGSAVNLHERIRSITRAAGPFNNPTSLAIGPTGELYVSDGYGNARVHRFSADGELLGSWGSPGSGQGEFRLPHGVLVTSSGEVLVADRENDRVQSFTLEGDYLGEWGDVRRPTALAEDGDGRIYVTEFPRPQGWPSFTHGPTEMETAGGVSIFDADGHLVQRLCWPEAPVAMLAPHGVSVAGDGRIFVAEVAASFVRGRRTVEDYRWREPDICSLRVFVPT